MSTNILAGYFALTLFFTGSFFAVQQQHNTHHIPDAGSKALIAARGDNEDGFAHVFLYYPLENSADAFSVFLNKKSIGKITSGGRLECKLMLDGPVAVTITAGCAYREPLAQSANSRIVAIKKGKSYYFQVNKNGSLEYILNTSKGEKSFAEIKDFIAPPVAYTETIESAVPALDHVIN